MYKLSISQDVRLRSTFLICQLKSSSDVCELSDSRDSGSLALGDSDRHEVRHFLGFFVFPLCQPWRTGGETEDRPAREGLIGKIKDIEFSLRGQNLQFLAPSHFFPPRGLR